MVGAALVRHYGRVAGLAGVALLVLGCSAQSLLSWEASDRSRPHYVVKSGDTLYSVAWGYGLDFRRLAVINDLHPPYPVSPGQLLRLPSGLDSAPARSRNPTVASKPPRPKPSATSSASRTGTVTATGTASSTTVAATPRPSAPAAASAALPASLPVAGRWRWPREGKVIKNWGARKHQKSGLDIAAEPGSGVKASAPGVVVYSGGGLSRYGQLVIVKHSEELLSAYAYNQKLLVKKGQQVKAGQRIALSGRGSDGVAAVHFEIRRRGKPVDALSYLMQKQTS